MKKILSILAFYFAFFTVSVCQAQIGWQWGKGSSTYDGWRMFEFGEPNVVTDKSGNVYISGINTGDSAKFGPFTIYNPNFCYQLVIAKLDSMGNYQWVVSTPANMYDDPLSIAVAPNGNLYAVEIVTAIGGGGATILQKYTSSGNLVISKFLFDIIGLAIDSSNFIYTSGALNDLGIYIKKYDENLFSVWNTEIAYSTYGTGIVTTGGFEKGLQNNLAVAKNGDTYIYGLAPDAGNLTFRSTSILDSIVLLLDTASFFLAKYSNSGNPIWAEKMNPNIFVVGMTCDDSGNIYMTGLLHSGIIIGSDTFGTEYTNHFYLCKYSSSGTYQWIKSVTGSGESYGDGISIDSKGNIWVTGSMSDSIDFNGNILYAPPRSADPIFIANYDVYGNYITSMALPTGGQRNVGISVDNNGSFYIGGAQDCNIYFGPDTLFHNDSLIDRGTLFVGKYKYCCSDLNVKQVPPSLPDISFYPNPATTSLTITSTNKISQLTITNLLGQTVYTHEYNTQKAEVNVADLPTGVYFIKINGSEVRKFVKE